MPESIGMGSIGHVGTSVWPRGYDHRDKLLCRMCLLMKFSIGHEQH